MSAAATTSTYHAGADWKYGLFGCFGDARLCVMTFLVPCYAIGKNTESLGENCLLHGLLATVFAFGFGSVTRWRLRQERGIVGTMLDDVLMHACCPCCALVQEAREIGWNGGPKNASGHEVDRSSSAGGSPHIERD